MTSGHAGCLSTVHASSPRDALARLETMALMADLELPLQALRGQLASAIDVIVQVERARSGQRVISHVTAVGELDAMGRYMSTDLYARSGSDAPLEPAPRLAQELAQLGIDPAALTHLDRSYP
jgi:pilus assembly protein CpaF